MKNKRNLMDFIEKNTSLAIVDCGEWFHASHYVERTTPTVYTNKSDDYDELCRLATKIDSERKINSIYLVFKNNNEELSFFMKERNIKTIHYV